MKNNSLHTVIVSILAVCVLVSTSSFTVNKRFCGESLIDASIFSELQECKVQTCTSIQLNSQNVAKDCCKEISDVIYGKENLSLKKVESEKIKVQKQQLLIATRVFSGFLEKNELEKPLIFYDPPLLPQKNLLQHYQVFII